MSNSVSSALRNAAERINAERSAWDGVGFMAIENLETGACSLVLVPKGTPRPNWSKELQDAGNAWHEVQPVAPVEDASPGNEVQPVALLENAWERYEDQQLAQWLRRRWGADLTTDDRFPELMNLLKLHLPAAMVAKLPAPSRALACGRGFNAHTVKPAALSADLRARLVAWLIPWERTLFVEGRQVCAWWHTLPAGVSLMWNPVEALHGADGRSCEEREAAGGMVQWGLVTGWSSVIDAVVAYLLAMADTPEAAPRLAAGAATKEKLTPTKGMPARLSKDRRHVVLVAVHEVAMGTKEKARPGTLRQDSAFNWASNWKTVNIRTHLASASRDWCPQWFVDLLCKEHGDAVTVEDLLEVCDESQFRDSVRKGMQPKQQMHPSAFVPLE
jgi:hypothetical protein